MILVHKEQRSSGSVLGSTYSSSTRLMSRVPMNATSMHFMGDHTEHKRICRYVNRIDAVIKEVFGNYFYYLRQTYYIFPQKLMPSQRSYTPWHVFYHFS